MATTQLAVGAKAPAFTLADQTDTKIKLSGFAGTKVLVYFYPKADTPGCTKQSCSLRDANADLTAKGVQVIGVSVDKPEAQKKFKDKFSLPYPLVSDPEGKVCEAFKVSRMPAIGLATRQAFIIKDGKVVWHDPKASTTTQADEIKAVLKELGV
jgi:peroxiredoxin Q/BCP